MYANTSRNLPIWATMLIALSSFVFAMAVASDNDQGSTGAAEQVSPILIKFEQFKEMFNKHYNSTFEEMRRRALLFANSIKAFVSQVSFQAKRSSGYLAVNSMSDWTQAEFDSTLIDDKALSLQTAIEVKEDQDKQQAQNDNVGKSILAMIQNAAKGLDVAIKGLYLPPKPVYRPELPDEVFVDHRRNNCFNPVRHQGICGSCYIFSTMALYEWAYCVATKSKIEFSEQYVLDCGRLSGLSGCDGGYESRVSDFVKTYGFQRLSDYNYVGIEKECSFSKKSDLQKMGTIRLDKPEMGLVWPKKFEEEHKKAPIIMSVRPSTMSMMYGGGLDEGEGCRASKSGHSVLLIGSGREKGHEYWIIRNSYGQDWGEMGHYKLRKDSDCIVGFHIGHNLQALSEGAGETLNFVENSKYNKFDTELLPGLPY